MTSRRTRVAIAAGALALAAVAAGSAADFPGKAKGISLTATEAKYRSVVQSVAAPRPAPDKRRGYRSGWQTVYAKVAGATLGDAVSLVYVYATPADARRAFARSCPACRTLRPARGIRTKVTTSTAGGTTTVTNVSTCRNVYTAVVITGRKRANVLARETATLTSAIYRKAASRRMTPCAAG